MTAYSTSYGYGDQMTAVAAALAYNEAASLGYHGMVVHTEDGVNFERRTFMTPTPPDYSEDVAYALFMLAGDVMYAVDGDQQVQH
ncbi:MAG: hypothetical protein GY933_25860 [Hyphomicrobiales bacterium]|nr:hypothetical protein [Hyphomicrobiales bacterium]